MRLGTLALAVGLLAGASSGCQRYLVNPKFDIKAYSPVAIVDFEAKAPGCGPDLGTKIADAILADVFKNKDLYRSEAPREEVDVSWTPPSVEFVERAQLEKVLGEQDFGATDRVDPGTAARIGSVTGAKALVVGQVTSYAIRKSGPSPTNVYDELGQQHRIEVSATISISYRVIDASSAKLLHVGNTPVTISFSDIFHPKAGEVPDIPGPDELRERLILEAAHAIGADFYYHFEY